MDDGRGAVLNKMLPILAALALAQPAQARTFSPFGPCGTVPEPADLICCDVDLWGLQCIDVTRDGFDAGAYSRSCEGSVVAPTAKTCVQNYREFQGLLPDCDPLILFDCMEHNDWDVCADMCAGSMS